MPGNPTTSQSYAKMQRPTRTLPLNLLKKLRREQRIQNNGVGRNRKRNAKKKQRRKQRGKHFETSELNALIHASEMELKEILANEDLLSDIPYDVTPEELQGEISLAQGDGMTIYVQRDGLSTLTIVLPQEDPTISQLKRAIEAKARVQLKRELRERQEERHKRRQQSAVLPTNADIAKSLKTLTTSSPQTQQQNAKRPDTDVSLGAEYNKSVRLTGELVCSTTHNGHQHRPNVSWRFLWRTYALYNLATKSLVNDANGRQLLSVCGIENAQTLKFTKREKYLGKKRQ